MCNIQLKVPLGKKIINRYFFSHFKTLSKGFLFVADKNSKKVETSYSIFSKNMRLRSIGKKPKFIDIMSSNEEN